VGKFCAYLGCRAYELIRRIWVLGHLSSPARPSGLDHSPSGNYTNKVLISVSNRRFTARLVVRPDFRRRSVSLAEIGGLTPRHLSLYVTFVAQMPQPKGSSTLLTRREREIMNAVFALGNRAPADKIRERLTNPPTDSAVRVMIARLEKKGFLKHQQDGARYLYSATISPAVAKRTALQQYLQTFFDGSLRQMMTALVGEEASWTDDDLDALKDEIDRVRKERKKHS
jgi:BlaI family transcriptional regulator, penicillinase repressor